MKTYVVGEPLERISLDILGPVSQTYKGNKYILVVTDYFTRFAEAYSLPDIEATTVADKLLTEFICRYGLPLQIHTDQGAQFTSNIFTEMCKRLHISKTRNSPYHPQSSGLVERLNHNIGFHFTPGTMVWLIPNLTFLATFTPSFNKHCITCPIESVFNSGQGALKT
jgi:transposase InsO family protein